MSIGALLMYGAAWFAVGWLMRSVWKEEPTDGEEDHRDQGI